MATSTFGIFRGKQVYLMHVARNEEGRTQLPMICCMRIPSPSHYLDFLKRKVQEGFESLDLVMGTENENIWVRSRHDRRRMRLQEHVVVSILNRFKLRVRIRLSLNRLRQRARARKLHEEIVQQVWHPRKVQRLLDLGLSIDDLEFL